MIASDPHPQLGCRCADCTDLRARIWRGLPRAQRHALTVLSFSIPRHPADLSQRDRVRGPTLWTLMQERPDRPALVHQHQLGVRILTHPTMPFYTLTQHGREIRAVFLHHERKAA